LKESKLNSIKYKDVLYEHRELSDLRDLIDSSAELFGDRDAFLVKDIPGGAYRPISYGRMKSDIDNLGAACRNAGFPEPKSR
jgi:long-chain acyl-CoA synthetase